MSNLSGSYTIGNGWSVDAGVDNLGDKRTRKIPEAARNASQRASTTFTYEYGDVLGTVGTYWFGRINYRF